MRYGTRLLAFLLAVVIMTSAPLFVTPPKAYAQFAVVETGPQLIKNTITSIAAVSSAASELALQIKNYVLDPLAFVLSGNLLRSITAGVIDFINGNNSTGRPLFVQDLRGYLLAASDVQAVAFFNEFNNSNSPFAPAILSSLRTNYLQRTSATGFWSANRSTLPQYSASPSAFIAGDFSQGGWSAWFALTTQPQNNPYTFYYRAQAELAARVEGATTNLLNELAWGEGFLSWCGDQASTGGTTGSSTGIEEVAITSPLNCTKADGTPGTIKTPGSVIRNALDKVLGADIDKLVDLGDAGTEINAIFENLATVIQVGSYGASLLGGNGSGGLFGVSQSTGAAPIAPLDQYRNQPGYFGVTETTISQNAGSITAASDTLVTRINKYEAALVKIENAAKAAQSAVANASSCPTVANQRSAAEGEIQEVLDQAAAAKARIASARAFAAQNPPTTGFANNIEILLNAFPTTIDVAEAEGEATKTNGAFAAGGASLKVTGGTTLDRMNLIEKNASLACSPFPFI
ncbi:hypothetical protein A3C95_00500 [Candidatus Kaiserbacteria bacterium RIFCSPHIGHO2_02_FULL_56_30]|uniref:Uncharacterized protein n=1 Tax=Candidatus Kaiserbacteria bacterium RIFCSPHIGHO2_02_FULL_56_30 TaxID=1798499 RepID=A0A1F6E211_9BACT|nr:MAG: hypothetical protein A3C95_00500 [Candidatus Kaiserbacteria bacterium RIFCSPHIGHO2_02_FULL_56_30]